VSCSGEVFRRAVPASCSGELFSQEVQTMRALLSVDNKEGIESFARKLHALGVEIVSTGKTAATLTDAGIPVLTVAEVTGFPELLSGRVKTLHPVIAAAILARRADPAHVADLEAHGIVPIDLVVCNLYPFTEAVNRGVALEAALEKIDIGGVTLLRAAAKNFADVTVVTHPDDYGTVLTEMEQSGATTFETRRRLAVAAFQHTALYDTAIAEYLRHGLLDHTPDELFPEELTLGLRRVQMLRYGENPHQSAALYSWGRPAPREEGAAQTPEEGHPANGHQPVASGPPTIVGARVLQGKELSFNNLLDLDAALAAAASFMAPTTVIIKHTNPCGLACADSLVESYRRAHAGDPVSAYGGIIGFNREVDEATADEVSQIFYDGIVAPGYSDEALDILSKRKNLRLLSTDTPIGPGTIASDDRDPYRMDLRRIAGGLLLQTADVVSDQDVQCTVMTERRPTLEEMTDLLFAWKAVRHVKSNAIVLAKKLMVVGVGAGQMNRVYCVQIAVDRAEDRARGSVLASDAYFPFPDGVETAAKAGVTAIIQPGGSIRDVEAIRTANKYGLAMVFTGKRHFRH
jgi:phosphoribosylaminoimidazolecarboxamide formyltransferase/IMP cyclohydrolase